MITTRHSAAAALAATVCTPIGNVLSASNALTPSFAAVSPKRDRGPGTV